jgi:3D (Asp-Asp-Asp) domain-containing protein
MLAAAVLVGLGVATGRTAESSSRVEPARPSTRAVERPAGTRTSSTAPLAPWSIERFVERVGRSDAMSTSRAHAGRASEVAEARTGASPDAVRETGSTPTPTFDGRPLRAIRTMSMVVTAYSPDARSCGASADGITASGYSVQVNGGCLVAADPKVLPLGSLVSVPGYDGGAVVPVLDTGGAIKGNRLDVLFPTHREAIAWGRKTVEVTVWEHADGAPSGFKRVRRKDRGGI